MNVPRRVTYGGPDESQTKPKRRSLAAAPPISQLVLVGFPNVVLGGRMPGAATRAARAPLSRSGGLRDVFSAAARASDLTRTQDRDPAAALSGLLFPHRRGAMAARWSIGVIGLIMDGIGPAR